MASLVELTEAEVQEHATAEDLWMIIDDGVYDVTKFRDEHPGGADVLVEHAGTDATQAFKDVGHSEDARELMKKYKVGKVQRTATKYSFRVHKEEEATSGQNKSEASAKASSVRIRVPEVCDPPRTRSCSSGTRTLSETETELTKSMAETRSKAVSCFRTPSVSQGTRSRSGLDQSRQSATSRTPSQITKPTGYNSSPRTDLSKPKPITVAKPICKTDPSRTNTIVTPQSPSHTYLGSCASCCRSLSASQASRSRSALNHSRHSVAFSAKTASQVESSREKPLVSPRSTLSMDQPGMKSVGAGNSIRHKACFTEPPPPRQSKSVIRNPTKPSDTKSATSAKVKSTNPPITHECPLPEHLKSASCSASSRSLNLPPATTLVCSAKSSCIYVPKDICSAGRLSQQLLKDDVATDSKIEIESKTTRTGAVPKPEHEPIPDPDPYAPPILRLSQQLLKDNEVMDTKIEIESKSARTGAVSKPKHEPLPDPDPYAPPILSMSKDVWKYALIALAGAVVVTIVLKKTGKI